MKICSTCQQTYSDDVECCPRDGARLAAQATETEAQLAAGLSRRFRIIRRLGEGGMGTVFLAEQIAVGHRPVALKVLLRKLLDNPDFLLRFQSEAASTGRIHHPNVVTIHESGQGDDGTPYIAMEFLEGESLRQALTRRGALPVPEVAEILQQAARGLNAAHRLGIIHRDLKPDNIFLTRGDEGELIVKVVDFGIAKLRESATHTQTGMVLGTPAYMSFEQASGMRSDELDARSDIYSLGVVTYEMLTGRVPFQSDTPVGYLRKHLQDAPPPFRAAKPDLPALPQLESVVMKALTKDRDQRYSSVLEFARQFGQATLGGSEPASQNETVKLQPQVEFSPVPKTIVPAAAGEGAASKQPSPAAAPSGTQRVAAASGRKSSTRLQNLGAPRSKLLWLLGVGAAVILIGLAWFWLSSGANGHGKEPKNPSNPVRNPSTATGAGQRVVPKQSEEWGLPITLGQTSEEVRQVLGPPDDIVNPYAEARKAGLNPPPSEASLTLQYFYSSGIVCRFDGNRLFGVTLTPVCDYKGFIPYSGAVVNGIKLTDSKDEILRKLGKETKIEEDQLEIGTDRDKPVVWPAGTGYYWRRAGYTVQVDFLRQAQSVSHNPLVTRPKDSVSVILVYK